MEATVRTSDRAIVQIGESVAYVDGCVTVELTDTEITQLEALDDYPHGEVYLAIDGSITADRSDLFNLAVRKLRSTFGTARTAQDANLCIDAITVILRQLFREMQ